MRTTFQGHARTVSFLAPLTALLLGAAIAFAEAPAAQPPAANAKADQAAKLVEQALQAEAAGKPAERDALLKQALAIAPDYAPAHWQSGELKSDNAWVSVDDAAKHDAHSAKLDEYRQRRDQAGQTVDDQLALAAWCEKAGLKEQQRAHLMFALQLQPNNEEAIAKLGLVCFRNALVSAAQLDQIKAQVRQSFAESKQWKQQAAAWQQQLRDKPKSVDDVAKQIRAVRDPVSIPSLEGTFANNSSPEIGKAVIDCLAAMPQQAATESLVRFAVFSPYEDVSRAAAYALRKRSEYAYVPILLGAMQAPIRVETNLRSGNPLGANYVVLAEQEGPSENYIAPASIWSGVLVAQAPVVHVVPSHRAFYTSDGFIPLMSNEQMDHLNAVLANVLQTTTDQHLGDNPTDWWKWWLVDENEYYEPPQKPNVTPVRFSNSCSCFPAGTGVWTMSGPMQIENIKVGELVLAQNTETGELAYKPVIGTTIRPASPVIETKLGEMEIRSTRGHPFWVDGIGWQMAKELKAGQWLHTAQGMAQIDSAEPSEDAVCYNLVVADFHDYFVSGAKLLVHDNLLRGPTLATVPGLAEGK
ncbi:MAG TPA: polymorphic toxin-type HINT domain-containing protein [Pirellulales bacterium]|nr:polymorphic toxin-type HINT domain-containing protein [Pirellulales bacterium]